ncbi:MAG: pyridoxamine 5'-phosphate oxidase family protein [Phycisphaeraceae bacterium]|nr:pyridoxamine 5'-phosphate oxidase family protein [Phycisphaeraceae bacterium]
MSDEWLLELTTFLDRWRTAGLATVDEKGNPYATNLYFARDGLSLYFVSSLETRHGHHIIRSPKVAMTVYADNDNPMFIQGVQMVGLCVPVFAAPEGDAKHWQRAWDAFTGRFPFAADQPLFREALLQECFFKFTPTWVKFLDSRKGFGFKFEKDLTEVLAKTTKKQKVTKKKVAKKSAKKTVRKKTK